MMTIRITDDDKRAKSEVFWNGEVKICSRSGLHATERAVLRELESGKYAPETVLIAGNRTGATAMALGERVPLANIACHAFDMYHVRSIVRNLQRNGFKTRFRCDDFVEPFDVDGLTSDPDGRMVDVFCTSGVPAVAGGYDLAVFTYTPGLMTAELLIDQLEDIFANLAVGGKLLLAAETPQNPLIKQVKEIFGSFRLLQPGDRKRPAVLVASKKGDELERRSFRAEFSASVEGVEPLKLVSLPGVFCHRRPDMGGLSLAEVAVRELRENATKPLRLLDMGCGCGLVGLLVAKAVGDVVEPVFVDSHARALESARINAIAAGVENARFVLSDCGAPQRGYDLFVGNPPYYSEYKIADVFLDTAHRVLRRGGVCYTVAKTAAALQRRQREIFGSAEELPRRGYVVLKSVR